MRRVFLILLLGVLCTGGVALAQTSSTMAGSIEGIVRVGDAPVPGVAVTIESPALQGKRTTVSGTNGDYIFRALPPGTYTITFSLTGMKTVKQTNTLALGGTIRQDASLEVATTAAVVTVSGSAIAAEEEKTAVHGATYTFETIKDLPVGRNLSQIAAIAPGVTTNTFNAGQLSISGAFGYDNKFLLNGVDINDNLFGTGTNQLYVQDAVQETQVMTSNISAEYGGFSGGIVNAITKSGGNTFSGTFRADFTNPDWRAWTPIESKNQTSRPSELSTTYSGTIGGKIITDRLWFFGAGFYQSAAVQNTLPITNYALNEKDTQYRYEGKLTGTITESHTLQFDYTGSKLTQADRPAFAAYTAETQAAVSPDYPATVLVGSYNGVFGSALIGNIFYSQKKFQYHNFGGTDTSLVTGSPFFSNSFTGEQTTLHYHAPYWDATDPEDRNNQDLQGSVSYYLSTKSLGTHEMKAGFDLFKDIRTGGNSQSPTNFVFYADYKMDATGNPVYDASGNLIPVWDSGRSGYTNYVAAKGGKATMRTDAIFFNDTWKLHNFSFNLGVRYEMTKGTGPQGETLTDTTSIVPRLGAAWDIKGDGRYRVSGSYAQYAGKYQSNQFEAGTPVGNPTGIYAVYTGPAGEGYGFAPAFNLANYEIFSVNDPTANVFFGTNVKSPLTTEWSASVGGRITPKFSAAVTYVNRKTSRFVESFTDNPTASGKTEIIRDGVSYGTFDNVYYRNTNVPKRKYEAIQFQASSSDIRNLQLGMNYTYMLKNEGSFVGEAANQPGSTSPYGDYPEVIPVDRTAPYGRLQSFQRHKLRVFGSYDFKTPIGHFLPGIIYNFDSGTAYSLTNSRPLTSIEIARDPGYASLPSNQTIYYGARGDFTYPSQQRWDLAMEWSGSIWGTFTPYARFAIQNLFNTQYLVAYNISVSPVTGAGAPVDSSGLPTTYRKSATFGTATSSAHYMQARTLTAAVGFRF